MGVIAHKALIVTGTDSSHLRRAYAEAINLFKVNDLGEEVKMVSELLTGLNQYKTFIVAPDGSKEGWVTSEYFDKKMDEMIKFLKSKECTFDDKSSYNDWVLVEYGETGRRVLKSNCKNMY